MRLSTLLARTITLHTIPVDDYAQRFYSNNSPWGGEEFLRQWAKTYEAMKRGETGVSSDLLGRILGREPRSMEACLRMSLGEDAVGQYAK